MRRIMGSTERSAKFVVFPHSQPGRRGVRVLHRLCSVVDLTTLVIISEVGAVPNNIRFGEVSCSCRLRRETNAARMKPTSSGSCLKENLAWRPSSFIVLPWRSLLYVDSLLRARYDTHAARWPSPRVDATPVTRYTVSLRRQGEEKRFYFDAHPTTLAYDTGRLLFLIFSSASIRPSVRATCE